MLYLWIIATLLAFFVKGMSGFANTLVLTSIMGFSADNVMISPVELILGYPANLILAIKEHKTIKWRLCLPLIALMGAGSLVGVMFLKNVPSKPIKMVCALVITGVGVLLFLQTFPLKRKLSFSPIALKATAIISGILCGLYGIGALLVVYVQNATEDTKAFKTNICVVFFAENTFRIVLYFVCGILTLESLKLCAILLPFMLLSLFLGMKLSSVCPEKLSRRLVCLLLIISGLAIALKTL